MGKKDNFGIKIKYISLLKEKVIEKKIQFFIVP